MQARQGPVIAVIISVIDVLPRRCSPGDALLLRDGELDQRLRHRLPEPKGLDGVLVYRSGAGLFFENAAHFADRLCSLVAGAKAPVRLIVIDCAAKSDIDYSGAATLGQLGEERA